MRPPRRAVKMRAGPKRAKPDTSHMLREESGFVVNEWLEVLLRVKHDQPRRYERETSAGLKVTVANYERLKSEHEGEGRRCKSKRSSTSRSPARSKKSARPRHQEAQPDSD